MIENWEKVFIYINEKTEINEAWLTPLDKCVMANRNIWEATASGKVIELIPREQHIRELEEFFKRGRQYGQLEMADIKGCVEL